jgi:hypothetical protein
LESKTREYSEAVIDEFRKLFDVVAISPTTIEKLVEMREFFSTLQPKIDHLSERILKNDSHFSLMENAKWQIPMDFMDIRWEVFKWL